MKRAALYIRVSTLEQAKEGYSVSAQTNKLEQFAKAKDLYVYKIYTDPGFSGAKLDRPGLQEMLLDIENKKVDVVLVYKLDRLSRSQKNTLYLIEDVFNANNVDFISLQESFDTSTPFGRATIGMLSVFAQLERDTITERMHMGRTERAKQGYYHGSGVVPLGYNYINGELIVNDYEAMIIKEIFDLYVNHNKGQQHITLRMVEKYPDKVKTLTLIKYALRNPLYIGKISWDGEIYQGHHTPIIDEDTFDKAQSIIKDRANKSKTNSNQQSLLAGFIYCGHCGAKVFREVSGGSKQEYKLKDGTTKKYSYKYNYYTCRSVKKTTPSLVKDWNCKQPRLRCEKVENVVISRIKELELDTVKSELENNNYDDSQKLKTIEKQILKKEGEKTKLLDLYQYSVIDVDTLNKRINDINASISNMQNEITDSSNNNHDKMKLIDDLAKVNWENMTTKEKINMIKRVVKKVEIKDDEVLVHFIF